MHLYSLKSNGPSSGPWGTPYCTCDLYSSSSSSPLLSLVQVPAKLAINLSIHTQHTYGNGVDRTGDRVFRKIQLLHEEREEEKKMFNPQTMLHLEYSLRTEKKTPQHKSTYTINTWHCNRGNISSSGKQPSGPVPFISVPVNRPARPSGGAKRFTEAVEWGRGVMSVVGEGRKRFPLHRSLRVVIQTALAKAPVRGARKDKIKLLWLWGEQLQTQMQSSFSLSILISEITKFHFQSCEFHHDGIHIPVYSLSLIADRSSHSFNQNGQPCETLDSCSRLLNFSITQGKPNPISRRPVIMVTKR